MESVLCFNCTTEPAVLESTTYRRSDRFRRVGSPESRPEGFGQKSGPTVPAQSPLFSGLIHEPESSRPTMMTDRTADERRMLGRCCHSRGLQGTTALVGVGTVPNVSPTKTLPLI